MDKAGWINSFESVQDARSRAAICAIYQGVASAMPRWMVWLGA
jgi:hypothetical protein